MLALGAPIRTESGLVEGVEDGDLVVFKGIPFAAPPVAALRWRAPQPPAPWSGVRKADHFAPICMQRGAYPEDSPPEPGSEDCLYLNIWVPPSARDGGLPVMVWIYGGGLLNGSGSNPLYAGDRLARRNVIVVTFNYRLGALGFLAHPQLTRESAQHVSGNYGMLDQVAALGWVQRNIAAFGGDPRNVTVFGQSSGSISISALSVSPLARGLFHRAIGQSGGLFEPIDAAADFTLRGAEQSGERFVTRAGAASLAELRQRPPASIIEVPFSPNIVIDGHFLTQTPYEAYAQGRQHPIDILVGQNSEDGRYFAPGRRITAANLSEELSQDFPSAIVALIGPGAPADDDAALADFVRFEGAMRFGWDMWAWAYLHARSTGRRAFFYRYAHASPFAAGDKEFGWRASHGFELPYVFGHLEQRSLPWTAGDRQLAQTMSAYWVNFARSGDPNGPGLPAWPAFTSTDSPAMIFGDASAPGRIANEADLRAIDRLYRTIRFVLDYGYALAAAVMLLVLVMLWRVAAAVRAWRARRSGRSVAGAAPLDPA